MRNFCVKCIRLLFIAFMGSTNAKPIDSDTSSGPWLTGPLLAPPGITQPSGTVNAEPYLFFTKNDTHPAIQSAIPYLSLIIGLADRLDLAFNIPYTFNEAEQRWFNDFQDITVILGIQTILSSQNNWLPNLRVVLQETFPTGKFKNLNPTRFGADSTGEGSYQTGIGANFQQLYALSNEHYLNLLLSLVYTFPGSVWVSGWNTYGGGIGTAGTVTPGKNFYVDFAFEYTLTQHWVATMDVTYFLVNQSGFTGNMGFTPSDHQPTLLNLLSNELVTLAPAVEYNFSNSCGIVMGIWFPVYTHNTVNFLSGVIAFNYVT